MTETPTWEMIYATQTFQTASACMKNNDAAKIVLALHYTDTLTAWEEALEFGLSVALEDRPEGTVPMPRNVAEARAMLLLAAKYLEDNKE